jgi:hypothetical protein
VVVSSVAEEGEDEMAAFAPDKVIGTTRCPDGRATGEIDGVVLREQGMLVIIDSAEALQRARAGRLVASIPGAASPVVMVAVDAPDGRQVLGTDGPEGDLLLLPIWDRTRVCWVNPLRPGGARLASPGT